MASGASQLPQRCESPSSSPLALPSSSPSPAFALPLLLLLPLVAFLPRPPPTPRSSGCAGWYSRGSYVAAAVVMLLVEGGSPGSGSGSSAAPFSVLLASAICRRAPRAHQLPRQNSRRIARAVECWNNGSGDRQNAGLAKVYVDHVASPRFLLTFPRPVFFPVLSPLSLFAFTFDVYSRTQDCPPNRPSQLTQTHT